MGGVLSSFFQSGSALLSSGNHRNVSESTRKNIQMIFESLRANPKLTVQRLEPILSDIPKVIYLSYRIAFKTEKLAKVSIFF